MTEKTAMQALDEGLAEAAAAPEDKPFDGAFAPPADNPEAMPAGHGQLDEGAANSRAHWAFRRIAYATTLFGLLLLPVALLIRTGRWSARILVAHDRGWEFGGW